VEPIRNGPPEFSGADDAILGCCLYLDRNEGEAMLLTNDVALQLKVSLRHRSLPCSSSALSFHGLDGFSGFKPTWRESLGDSARFVSSSKELSPEEPIERGINFVAGLWPWNTTVIGAARSFFVSRIPSARLDSARFGESGQPEQRRANRSFRKAFFLPNSAPLLSPVILQRWIDITSYICFP
jgi:hypothetical protein